MKPLPLALAGLLLALPLRAEHTPMQVVTQPGAAVKVTASQELTDLADGYARAFRTFSRAPVNLLVQRGDKVARIPEVTKVDAVGAVLRVEVKLGLVYLVNPRDVITFTDDTRVDAPAP